MDLKSVVVVAESVVHSSFTNQIISRQNQWFPQKLKELLIYKEVSLVDHQHMTFQDYPLKFRR